jgi:hypothetical protein
LQNQNAAIRNCVIGSPFHPSVIQEATPDHVLSYHNERNPPDHYEQGRVSASRAISPKTEHSSFPRRSRSLPIAD